MSDWSLVGGDPAPGDPGQIRLRVGGLQRTAENLRTVSSELSKIARGASDAEWRGDAADAMRELLDGFRSDLHPIATSFDNVSSAMGSYAMDLEELQQEARQALRRAQVADAERAAAERDREAAAAILGAQRSNLDASQNAERLHALSSVTTTVLDPASSAANAQEAQRLAAESARARSALAETEARSQRIEASLRVATAALDDAKRDVAVIKSRWDQSSRRAARQVEAGLASELRNKSNLEKFQKRLEDALLAAGRFLNDPIPYIAALRKIIDKVQGWVGWISTALFAAAQIAGILSFIPGVAAIALFLAGGAAIFSVVTMALAAAKLVTGMMLWGNSYREGGREVVTLGGLGGDIVGFGFAVTPFRTGSAKTLRGLPTSRRALEKAEEEARSAVMEQLRRDIVLRTGSPGDVAHQAVRDFGHVAVEVVKEKVPEDLTTAVVTPTLDGDLPWRHVTAPVTVPVTSLARPIDVHGTGSGGGGGGGGAGW